jgi:hypothetical protein
MIPEYLIDDRSVATIFKGETIEQISARYNW